MQETDRRRQKTNWLKKRDEVVYAKGKGEMETYWLVLRAHSQWFVSIW
jgi:hypothetical protein